jgi:hypothetical protein
LALLFFFDRIYVKLCLTKKLSWDDGTIVIATVSDYRVFHVPLLTGLSLEAVPTRLRASGGRNIPGAILNDSHQFQEPKKAELANTNGTSVSFRQQA